MENNAEDLLKDSVQKELKKDEAPKYKESILAYSHATLGISMVVAVLIGVGVGYALEQLFDYRWLFWLGVVWGVLAAILNIYKAYKMQKKELDELSKDPKYSHVIGDKEDDEEDKI